MRRRLISTLGLPLVMFGTVPAKQVNAQDDLWAAVRNLPAESRVRVTLVENGTNVTGRLVELREDAVVMRDNAADRAHAFRLPPGTSLRDAVPFARAEVSRASLVEIALPYRPDTAGDPAILKRVVSEFGGEARKKRLEVRSQTTKVNGTIEGVSADDFSVKVGRDRVVRVPYAEVVSVRREPRYSKGDWISIGAVTGGLGALIAYCGMGYCEQ